MIIILCVNYTFKGLPTWCETERVLLHSVACHEEISSGINIGHISLYQALTLQYQKIVYGREEILLSEMVITDYPPLRSRLSSLLSVVSWHVMTVL
jgi:hypothetical protein